MTQIRYTSFPRTTPPPEFIEYVIRVFVEHESAIATTTLGKGLTSNAVLQVLYDDLLQLGFEVEGGKKAHQKIARPVFFGEGGQPTLRYEIDAFHENWRCGLEIEAGRAWMGNAVYRDLIQASLMVNVDFLVLAVPNEYRYNSGGKAIVGPEYDRTISLVDAIYGHTRLQLPYGLIVVGY